ncbi:MAG TPA: thiamine pyrophosphate-dependent enzyme [Myxococcota bacterium]
MSFDAFARNFAEAGGRHVFGVTGGGPSLELIDALIGAGARYVPVGHETTAGLMAGACARQTGRPALAVTIKGPGFINLVPALLSNAYEGFPSVSISESYAWAHRGSRRHKWLDHRLPIREFVRGHLGFQADEGFFSHCWARATAGVVGPVHVDIGALEEESAPLASRAPVDAKLAECLTRIEAARRPAVICGSWCLHAPALAALRALPVPVFTTAAAKGFVPERAPNAAGVLTGAGKAVTPERALLPEADLLVGFGLRAGELLETGFDLPAVLFDDDALRAWPAFPSAELGQPVCHVGASALEPALRALEARAWGEAEVGAARQRLRDALDAYAWSPARCMVVAQELLPDAVHVLDTGNFTVLGEHVLQAREPRDVLGTPNGRFMGTGIGYALGAARALPERPVLLWIGDGGIRGFLAELAIARDLGLPLCVCVMSDGYYGSIRGRAMAAGLDPAPVTLPPRPLAGVARVLGLQSAEVGSVDEFGAALRGFSSAKAPAVVECRFEADDYERLASTLR